jgi:arylsulfatase A-like enzyme
MLPNPNQPQKKDHVVVETEFGTYGRPYGCKGRAIRTQKYKYMVYDQGGNHEFFVNMDNDPGETINLVGNPDYQKELDRHRALLRDYIVKTDDIFPIDMVPVPNHGSNYKKTPTTKKGLKYLL